MEKQRGLYILLLQKEYVLCLDKKDITFSTRILKHLLDDVLKQKKLNHINVTFLTIIRWFWLDFVEGITFQKYSSFSPLDRGMEVEKGRAGEWRSFWVILIRKCIVSYATVKITTVINCHFVYDISFLRQANVLLFMIKIL